MVVVGLVGCLAAALLSTDKPIGAVELNWDEKRPLPDSRPAAIPGGGEMRIVDAGLRASAPNISGYRLYRVAAVLRVDAGAAIGQGRVRCAVRVPRRTIVAHTPNKRASYPRPSEDLVEQPVPPKSIVEFNSHGTDLAAVELGDAFSSFTDQPGIVVEWAPFRLGQQVWDWGLPSGRPSEQLHLAFASIWRTTAVPAARVLCTLTTSADSTTVQTTGALR